MKDTVDVALRPEAAAYVLRVNGEEAGLAEFRDHTKPGATAVREFHHTVIDPAFRGRGLSVPLICAALADAGARGMNIAATCSAVAAYIDRHGVPERECVAQEDSPGR